MSQRADDNEETIKKRIEIFNAKNNEIVEHYEEKVVRVSFRIRDIFPFIPSELRSLCKLIVPFQINAEGTVEEIFAEVTKALDALLT